MNAKPEGVRKLPFGTLGAKQDVWAFIADESLQNEDRWVTFQATTLNQTLRERAMSATGEDRKYSVMHISRTLSWLKKNGYIEYTAGTRGQASIARLCTDEHQNVNTRAEV